MTAANWALLVPAIVAILTALTAWIRAEAANTTSNRSARAADGAAGVAIRALNQSLNVKQALDGHIVGNTSTSVTHTTMTGDQTPPPVIPGSPQDQ